MKLELSKIGRTVELKDETVSRYEKYEKLCPSTLADALSRHMKQEPSETVSDEELNITCNHLLEREVIFLELLLPNSISLAIHALKRVEDKSFVTKESTVYDVLSLSFDFQKATQLSAISHNMEKLVEKYDIYHTFAEVAAEIKKDIL